MKKIYFYTLLLGLLAFTACEDEKSPVMELQKASAFEPFSQSDFTFNDENAAAEFPEIKWTAADYGVKAVVNYDVTLTNDANAKTVLLGETGTTSLKFTNGQMNTMMAKVGAYPGQTYNFTITLTSKAYDMTADPASNSITFKATLFDPNAVDWKFAYVAVGYSDWDYTNAYLLGDPDGDGVYQGYANFDADGVSYAIIDGSDLTKVLAKDQTAAKKGFYGIKVDAEGKVEQTEPLVWGVVGDATSGGWDKDTQMDYDATTRLWTVTTSLLDKEFKFRSNNNWDSDNYGAVSGKESELEGELVAGPNNFKVLKASPYVITMNLTNAGKYSYSMVETTIELSSAEMALPGSYQGWDATKDDCYKVQSAARDFIYTGTFYFDADTKFKFWDAGVWIGMMGPISWDEAKNIGTFVLMPSDGDNIKIETAGYYRVGADMKKLTASLTKTGWEIIGDATPGGWDKGTMMNYDPATKLWSVDVTLVAGEMKFRWDGAWTVNLGGSLGALTQDGANMKVTAGAYTIVLNPDAKTATMTKK